MQFETHVVHGRQRAPRTEQTCPRQLIVAADVLDLEQRLGLAQSSGCQHATPDSNSGIVAHASSARGQRLRNGQPGGNSPRPATEAAIAGSLRVGMSSSSGGIASSSARVYGCRGRSKTVSTSPDSTMKPPYRTSTRGHTLI